MHLVLSYFHKLKGPEIYLSYPNALLEQDLIDNLIRIFDLEFNETFFEIVLINKKKRIINLYFEIPSGWARGKKEMVMLSLIMKIKYDSRMIYSFLVDASHKILKTNNVYKAFYKYNDFYDNDIEIDLNHEIVKKILFNCLENLIKRLESKPS